jgi:hypothetical protein
MTQFLAGCAIGIFLKWTIEFFVFRKFLIESDKRVKSIQNLIELIDDLEKKSNTQPHFKQPPQAMWN